MLPQNEFFRCVHNSIFYRESKIRFRWADECSGASRNYDQCARDRIVSNDDCCLTLKRNITDDFEMDDTPGYLRIRCKDLKNLREKDFLQEVAS